MEETLEMYPLEITCDLPWEKPAAALQREALDEQRIQIRNSLKKTDKGGIASTYENYEAVLRCDPLLKGAIRLNELTGRNDIVREMWWPRTSPAFDDLDMNYIILYIERYYGLGSDKKLERALKVVASDHRFHPIQDVLNDLIWDGTRRIRSCLRHFLGAAEDDYTEAMLLHFLLGAILRMYKPGCKYEEILCLVGCQGIGKSTFFRFLAINDDWFSDDIRRLDDDKVFQRLQGHWIIEMSEMLATNNAKSVEESRSFFSRQKDTYRTPYESQPKDRPRQCVFGGTSNSMDFLPLDRAGNRRFLPVVTEAVEPEIHILENEAESRAIADIMRNNFTDKWEPFPNPRSFGPIYGKQKGWQRIEKEESRGDADDSEFLCKPGNQVQEEQLKFTELTKEEAIESGVYDVFPDAACS